MTLKHAKDKQRVLFPIFIFCLKLCFSPEMEAALVRGCTEKPLQSHLDIRHLRNLPSNI